jgi:hypothetical protein
MRKAIYTSDEERELLVKTAQSNGEYLIEDAITIDGKYLIFAAAPPEPEPQPEPNPVLQLNDKVDILIQMQLEREGIV